jgi:hypothetical protein
MWDTTRVAMVETMVVIADTVAADMAAFVAGTDNPAAQVGQVTACL